MQTYALFLSHLCDCKIETWVIRMRDVEEVYLYQRLHQSLSISQSLVFTERTIISHFVFYKWHEED